VVVAALLAKALNRAEDGVVDSGVEVARKAVEALRRRFSREGDAEAGQALEGLVEASDSKRREAALADLLEDRAAGSAELLGELKAIAERIEATGVRIGDIKQEAQGTNVVQNAGITNSEIKIDQGAAPRSRE
jgi:hypothetical protein